MPKKKQVKLHADKPSYGPVEPGFEAASEEAIATDLIDQVRELGISMVPIDRRKLGKNAKRSIVEIES
jgi:hypothetical protein